MDNGQRYYTLFAGVSGFLAVAMGAAAAHTAHDPYAADLLRQASLYQLAHTAAILPLSSRREWPARLACFLFAAGIVLFCGGLCIKAFEGATLMSTLIPWGGGALMLGWLAVAVMAFTPKPHQGA